MSMSNRKRVAAALAALMGCSAAGAADEGWEHTVAFYMVGASMDGDTGIGDVTADVDVSFGDILDNLEFGAMAAYRGERGPWAVVADLIYMKLEQQKDNLGPLGGSRATVDSDQTIFELDGSYELSEQLSTYAGLRYWDLSVDLQVVGGGPLGETRARSADEDWVDPLVGLRYVWPLGERWSLIAKGDVGGFGIGSDFAWQASAFASWAFAEHASLLFGVRFLDVDYEDGSGNRKFTWDVLQGGPSAGLAWRF